jgi:hypothetical protein
MPRRPRNPLLRLSLQRSLTRSFGAITRTMVRAGTQAIGKPAAKRKPVTKREPAASPRRAAQSAAASVGPSRSGMAIGSTTTLRYQLYKPPGAKRGEQLPLMVMLHGCTQDGAAIAASSRMNSIAARERFIRSKAAWPMRMAAGTGLTRATDGRSERLMPSLRLSTKCA